MARGLNSDPAADSRLFLLGTAMGPVGTSRVSAVWRFATSRETRCHGDGDLSCTQQRDERLTVAESTK